ncbi:heme-binding protein 2 isoform X2 [Procambarus clarkii]|nr:heme-binding protein 2-like isoform X1 [Procambarus clarkii]
MAAILKGIRAAFGDVEMAPYTVVAERDSYEERIYPARKWACTTMKGLNRDELISPMFRALFNYISGKNDPNIRIDMTSPVTTYVEPGAGPDSESTFTMGFLVPEEYQQCPPQIADKTIFFEDRPELTVLTRRFGGYANDEIILKEVKELAEAIKKSGEIGVNFDQYYIVGYDPPFKLFSRRNEIWFIKTKDNFESKEENDSTRNEENKNRETNGSLIKDCDAEQDQKTEVH